MTSSLSSVAAGLVAALRLARGRADCILLISGDHETVARSFWAIAFCVPSVVARLLMSWVEDGKPASMAHPAGRELLVFVLGWLVFVEVTNLLAPMLGRTERWGRFIAVWNWCNVIEGVLINIGGLPGLLGAPPFVAEASEVIAIGWALWLEWFATHLALDVTASTAGALVLLDLVIGIVLISVAVAISV